VLPALRKQVRVPELARARVLYKQVPVPEPESVRVRVPVRAEAP
jgi:hypothetical protein